MLTAQDLGDPPSASPYVTAASSLCTFMTTRRWAPIDAPPLLGYEMSFTCLWSADPWPGYVKARVALPNFAPVNITITEAGTAVVPA